MVSTLPSLPARAPAGAPVQLPLSREDIADYLGLQAETVGRGFTKPKHFGLFQFLSPIACEVPDPEALANRLPVPVRARRPGPGLPDSLAPAGEAAPGCPARQKGAPRLV